MAAAPAVAMQLGWQSKETGWSFGSVPFSFAAADTFKQTGKKKPARASPRRPVLLEPDP
jgi:hypothetical protein